MEPLKDDAATKSSTGAGGRPCRLIYKSRTSWDLLSNETLLELAETSAGNNEKLGITGLLVLAGENFLQVLEGPAEALNDLYLKIARDKRHSHPRLLRYERITRRAFADWAMHVVDLDDLPPGDRDFLRKRYPTEDGSVVIPDDDRMALRLLHDAKKLTRSETERGS